MLILFLILFTLILFCGRYVGFSDPLLQAILGPLAGISFLIVNRNDFNYDYFTFLFSLCSVLVFSLFYSTPRVVCPKKLISTKVLFIIKIYSVITLLVVVADLIFNNNSSNSVYALASFDKRGDIPFSGLRFAYYGLINAVYPLLIILRKLRLSFFSNICLLSIILQILKIVLSPSKGSILDIFSCLLFYIFWKIVLVDGFVYKPLFQYSSGKINRSLSKVFISYFFPVLLFVIFSLWFISTMLLIDPFEAFDLILFRIFDVGYDLTIRIIDSDLISLDLNNPISEFPNILALWFKPILKAFGSNFVIDTIPKYYQYLSSGIVTYGVSSPTTNLILETTLIHGRLEGLLISFLIMFLSSRIRFFYLSSNTLNIKFLLFFPVIQSGPYWCFNATQFIFASYIPYLIVLGTLALVHSLCFSRENSFVPL